MDTGEDKRLQVRLAGWRKQFEGKRAEDFTAQTVQQLRLAVAENRKRLREPWEHLSTGTLNVMSDFSRWLSAIVAAVAAERAALGLVPDLLGDDRERSEAAWLALKTAAANRAAAAAVELASVTVAAAPGDQSQVNAKQLAAHAGCSDRQIRKLLQDCPAETDSTGRRLWRYCDAVGPLRRWSANPGQDRFRVVWPDLAKNLQKTKAGTKKK
jgi:hypothetical protein